MSAAKTPAGNPMKMEKNIWEDKISVTRIVTKTKVIIESIIEVISEEVLFI
jgi:hypothetical protein